MSKPSREIEVPKIASQSGDPGLYEVLRDIVKRTSAYVNDLIDTHRHGTDDIDDLTAASVANVPAGSISSTNVQDALNELDSEKITTDGTARTIVKKAGTVVGTRRGINLIEGANVTLTVADDGANEEVDVTISGAGTTPTGTIAMYGAATAPSGWLLCDGSAVSRSTYAALFAIVSTTFGVGDGSTTFNLPNLRQRFPLGKAASGTGSTLGGTGGAIDHAHSFSATTGTAAASAYVTNSAWDVEVSTDLHEHSVSGTTGTNNPPFQVVEFIIKA